MLRIAEFIAKNYSGKVVEVGIGNFTAVAEYLAKRGFEVVATDVVKRRVPEGVRFYIDDVSSPKLDIYRHSSLIYSLRPPPELYGHILRVAKEVGADCLIKPLYGDYYDCRIINYKGLSFYLRRGNDV